MKDYYVNKNAQSNGDHEVHTSDCSHLPDYYNRQYLGYFTGCKEAIKEAKNHYSDVDGCFYCCYECHKS